MEIDYDRLQTPNCPIQIKFAAYLEVVATGVPTIVLALDLAKTIPVVADAIAGLDRELALDRTLATTAVGVAGLDAVRSITLAVTPTAVAGLAYVVPTLIDIPAVATATPSVTKALAIERTLAATAGTDVVCSYIYYERGGPLVSITKLVDGETDAWVDITNGVSTNVLCVDLGAYDVGAGALRFMVTSEDGLNYQSAFGTGRWNALRSGAQIVCDVDTTETVVATGGTTLSTAWTMARTGNSAILSVIATSSIATPTMKLYVFIDVGEFPELA